MIGTIAREGKDKEVKKELDEDCKHLLDDVLPEPEEKMPALKKSILDGISGL